MAHKAAGGLCTKGKASIRDPFWTAYTELVRNTVIPYQWEALNDRIEGAVPSRAVRNFRIAARLEEGEFGGFVFQDSDLAKWLEAAGHALADHPDPELERIVDETVDLIAAAQFEDGYINTYYALKEPGKRWSNVHDCHELYCAGHLIEAAVAYYEATGKRKLLDVVCRFADHIDSVFGPEPGKLHGYCGHQEIELALVKLYETTGEGRYLRLSQYFIDERGKQPSFFLKEYERNGQRRHWSGGAGPVPDLAYSQAHLPVREQSQAVGHAVRAVYMYSAMADLARLTGDAELLEACRRLWSNVTRKQLYITGGIGSTHHGEAFTFDYDLPNDTVYAETCASIGLIFWAHRMLQAECRSEYADVLERALYNNVLGSMSQDGKHYFYVNPLEVWPEASMNNPGRKHVKPVRQPWYGCSCCPPNVARLLSSLGKYIYSVRDNTLYTHLYIGSEWRAELKGEAAGSVRIEQKSGLPWNGSVSMTVHPSDGSGMPFKLALRIPAWVSDSPSLSVNGQQSDYDVEDGYAIIDRSWRADDTVEWRLPMEARRIEARPELRGNAGKVAIERGPLVYCVEEADNGRPISSLALSPHAPLRERFDAALPGGAVAVETEGTTANEAGDPWGDELYRPAQSTAKPVTVRAVPYFMWGNRTAGEMAVWIRCK
jgi:uncharacterized protein